MTLPPCNTSESMPLQMLAFFLRRQFKYRQRDQLKRVQALDCLGLYFSADNLNLFTNLAIPLGSAGPIRNFKNVRSTSTGRATIFNTVPSGWLWASVVDSLQRQAIGCDATHIDCIVIAPIPYRHQRTRNIAPL